MTPTHATTLIEAPIDLEPGEALRIARAGAAGRKKRTCASPSEARNHPSIATVYYDDEECAFLAAIQAFKDRTGRQFPTWSDALRVLKALGYIRPKAGQSGAVLPN